ncbi:MAG: cell division protein FtsX [Fimbriimonas sp.]
MFDRLTFVVGEAFQNLRRHGFMTFSAIAVVAISLTIIGGLGFVYASALDFASTVPGRFNMYVLLKDGTTQTQISQTAGVIRDIPGVGTVNWIPRDKAWARQRQQNPELTEGIENPLQDAYKVTLKDLGRTEAVADAIRQLPAVDTDGVQYASTEQQVVQRWLRFLQWVGSIGVLLFIIAGILIYNTIRLAAIARRTEVRIMRLVGASRATVAIPFLLEGLLEGAVGGALSAFFVWGGWRILTDQFSRMASVPELQTFATTQAPAPAAFPMTIAFAGLTALGAVYGLLCSSIALRIRPETR